MLSLFKIGHSITRNFQHALRFAVMKIRDGKTRLMVNGHNVWLRNNKTDKHVFIDTFYHQYHRPPIKLPANPTIVDLGSNIGLTLVDFKLLYPTAIIVGVEPDPGNYEICLQNIAGLDHCCVVQAAIWIADGTVAYEGTDEQSYAITETEANKKGTCQSITIDSFIRDNKLGHIDYMKMDIEGAEYNVLLNDHSKNWLRKVTCLSIEVHDTPGLTKEIGIRQLLQELENNNFQVSRSANHWSALFAINKKSLQS